MFLVARFLNGIGVGMINVTVPIYQSEISPAQHRGTLVGQHGFMLCVGYVSYLFPARCQRVTGYCARQYADNMLCVQSLSGWAGYGCWFITNAKLQWRLCLSFQIIAPLLLLIGSPWIPESPRWLCAQDRTQAAFDVLRKLHPGAHATDDSFARAELDSICRQVQIDATQLSDPGWRGILSKASCRKRLFFGFLVQ